ncbi:hypothetical protein AYI69_g1863 [Smittium culicis]|uniref:Uncharacterized protein n=1 Tax=Smittium culicis TaxID=133412 RepID=A0A1R1YPI0_9FUNG|nr:hypothetical protein AYI69_g1863 [Smittium culicis]
MEPAEGKFFFVFLVDEFGVGQALGSPVAFHSHFSDVLESQPQCEAQCGEANPIAFVFNISAYFPVLNFRFVVFRLSAGQCNHSLTSGVFGAVFLDPPGASSHSGGFLRLDKLLDQVGDPRFGRQPLNECTLTGGAGAQEH